MSTNETETDREKPAYRRHETYKEKHWTVVDIRGVDKVFATPGLPKSDDETPVRIDMDGVAAASTMRDVGEVGDDINTSAWVPLEEAVELRDQLTEAINNARGGRE